MHGKCSSLWVYDIPMLDRYIRECIGIPTIDINVDTKEPSCGCQDCNTTLNIVFSVSNSICFAQY